MTLLDKVIAAVILTEDSDKDREARAKAQAAADSTGWLALVLEHYQEIESFRGR